MKLQTANQVRLETLYRQKLVRSETTSKRLPLERILQAELAFHPGKPDPLDFDILEIGPGRGDFLFHLSETHPDKKIVAIEIGKKRYHLLKKRLDERGSKNLTLICGDARVPLMRDFAAVQLEKVFVLFPDPWPRNCHRHKRLLQKDFLRVLCDRLRDGGEFTLATDVEDYANWVLQNLLTLPDMHNQAADGGTLTTLPDLIPTYFEQKWRKMGRSVWCVRFTRRV